MAILKRQKETALGLVQVTEPVGKDSFEPPQSTSVTAVLPVRQYNTSWWLGHAATPLKNMKVNWDDYSQY